MKIKSKRDRVDAAIIQAMDTIRNHEQQHYIHPEIAYSLMSSLLDIADALGSEKCKTAVIKEYLSL